jgi:hypothetical protein
MRRHTRERKSRYSGRAGEPRQSLPNKEPAKKFVADKFAKSLQRIRANRRHRGSTSRAVPGHGLDGPSGFRRSTGRHASIWQTRVYGSPYSAPQPCGSKWQPAVSVNPLTGLVSASRANYRPPSRKSAGLSTGSRTTSPAIPNARPVSTRRGPRLRTSLTMSLCCAPSAWRNTKLLRSFHHWTAMTPEASRGNVRWKWQS